MDTLTIVILGLVQGVTEFVPISSSAHLLLIGDFLTIDEANSLAFYAVLHIATTAAIILYFRNDIWVLVQTSIRKLGRLPVNEKDLTLLYALLVGTVPAVIIGLLFEEIITAYLYFPKVIAGFLFISSFLFMYAEWKYYTRPPHGNLNTRRAFWIGCFQALALLPGFSRSGSTLAGGMLLGLTRVESARFSFLLAIPITLGVGFKMLLELITTNGSVDWIQIGIGATVSFITALIVIHYFLGFIRRYTLWPFIWYKIILSIVVVYVVVYV